VDGQAHEGALQAGGRTIAVLGNGLADVYPPEHKDLAVRVAEHGAVISEIPLDTAPDAQNFPRRNRIIVGLSAGLLVVEAGDRSGALISARLATEYNREIFAVPGRVDTPQASGTNALIRDGGAKLVTSLEDVLDELHAVERRVVPRSVRQPDLFSPDDRSGAVDLSADEQAVLAVLDADEVEIDALTDASGLPVPRVSSALTTLQLKGQVVRLPGGRYTRRQRRPDAHPARGDP
jgi:DNA processing protein